eukprot:366028-Rhodomonas_salina.2
MVWPAHCDSVRYAVQRYQRLLHEARYPPSVCSYLSTVLSYRMLLQARAEKSGGGGGGERKGEKREGERKLDRDQQQRQALIDAARDVCAPTLPAYARAMRSPLPGPDMWCWYWPMPLLCEARYLTQRMLPYLLTRMLCEARYSHSV